MAARGVRYAVLGGLVVVRDGAAVDVPRGRVRSLLGLLLVRRNTVVSVDELADGVWAGSPPRSARPVLQGYIAQLRKLLGAAILTEGPGYRLVVEDECLDAAQFERLLEARRFEEALELWRGPALADFAFESWAQGEAGRLEELRLLAREGLAQERLDAGGHREVVAELEALLEEQPLRERPRALLMLALYRSGRQAQALDVYQRGRGLFVDELGIDPGPELQELHHAILNQDPSLDVPVRAGLKTNIPSEASSLVGRTGELADLAVLLARPEVRIVTLTGPGGTGKTRLAVAAAAARVGKEPDGVWFVDLSALRDPRLMRPSVAQALGTSDELDVALRAKRLLLVLDNFEQVLDAAVEVAGLVRAHPGVRILVTSRERLRLEGEHQFEVQPLPQNDAVTLFVERARALDPSFTQDGNVPEICRRLDGLPLAIQLAAARVKLLSTDEILTRLDQRLPLLTQGARDLPERQRTLRGTIAWSCELLGEEERAAFEAVSVFAGGFTLEAAEEVADVELETLSSLVDRSLVRAREARFTLLETIREFAAECLEERGDSGVRERHARFYLDLAQRGQAAMSGDDQPGWLDALEREHDNLRAALDWSFAHGEAALNARLAAALGRFWIVHGHFNEGRRRLEQALALDPPDELRFEVLVQLQSITVNSEQYDVAAVACEQAVELARRREDREGLGRVLNNFGIVCLYTGRFDEAAAGFQETVLMSRERDDEIGVAIGTHNLGEVARARGDLEEARSCFEASLEISGRLNHAIVRAHTLGALGATLADAGEVAPAASLLAECLSLVRSTNDLIGVAEVVENAAQVALEREDPVVAARLLGAADALRSDQEAGADPIHAQRLARLTESAQAALGVSDWERAFGDGQALDAAAAAALTLSLLEAASSAD